MASVCPCTPTANLAKYCQLWRLKPSTSKTVTSVFHLHDNSSLNVQHYQYPVYLGVSLDQTLSYREHLSCSAAKIEQEQPDRKTRWYLVGCHLPNFPLHCQPENKHSSLSWAHDREQRLDISRWLKYGRVISASSPAVDIRECVCENELIWWWLSLHRAADCAGACIHLYHWQCNSAPLCWVVGGVLFHFLVQCHFSHVFLSIFTYCKMHVASNRVCVIDCCTLFNRRINLSFMSGV